MKAQAKTNAAVNATAANSVTNNANINKAAVNATAINSTTNAENVSVLNAAKPNAEVRA